MIPVFDLHQDLISALRVFPVSAWSGTSPALGHGNLERLKRSGYKLIVQAVFPLHRHWGAYLTENPVLHALRMVERLHELAEEHAEHLMLVKTREDLETLLQGDRLGFLIGYEGMYGLEDRWVLKALYRCGVRVLGLTWNVSNLVATGAWDEHDRGLSDLGRKLVLLADELGFILDLAHASPRTYQEVLALPLQRPPIVSHTGVLPGTPRTRRNISIEQARHVAQRGGLVGLALAKLFFEDPKATLDTVTERIERLWREIPEHLALGTDFFGFGASETIEGLETVEGIRRLEQRLRQRGLPEAALEAVFFGNALRYLRAHLPAV